MSLSKEDSRKEHLEYQKKHCLLCFKKCDKAIQPKSKELIIRFVYPELERNEEFLPKNLCETCKVIVSSLQTPKPRPLERLPDFEKLVLNVRENQRVKTLRSGAEKPCGCELCRLGAVSKKQTCEIQVVLLSLTF